jgi:hypothetical protein
VGLDVQKGYGRSAVSEYGRNRHLGNISNDSQAIGEVCAAFFYDGMGAFSSSMTLTAWAATSQRHLTELRL